MAARRHSELTAHKQNDPEYRAAVDAEKRAVVEQHRAHALAELRKAAGLTQSDLAGLLGITQPSVSKLEHLDDISVSTLSRFCAALGGGLELRCNLNGESIPIDVAALTPS